MKLTLRLTLVFILYALALLAVVAWLAYNSGKESLRSATVSELKSTAIEKQAALNEWVEEKRTDISSLAASPTTLESAVALFAAMPGSSKARIARENFIREVEPRVDGGEFLVVMLLDPNDGQVIAATDPIEEGKFKENRLFFLNGRGAPYVQSVYYSIALQGPAMTASAPILSADGKLLGVLAGRLNLAEMNAIINRRAGLWQTDEAFLVNTSNLFVTQPRLSPNPAVLQQGVYSEAVNRCQSQTSGTISALDYRNVPALIVYDWLPEHSLCLIVKIDQAEALAPAFEFGHKVAVISAIALLGAAVLGVFISRGITRPIREMQSGVIRFGQGEPDIRLPERGQDELGDLAREFNRMSALLVQKDARLHEYATELEHKVEERTALIKQREERYRSYIELTGQLGWTANAEGEFATEVPSWLKYTGQTEEEVVGWGWTKALHPDDLDRVTQSWKSAVATKTNYEEECRLRRYDGVFRHFLARGVPIYKDDGEIQEWVGTCIDITERKQAEEEIASLSRFPTENPNPVLRVLNNGQITYANSASQDLLEMWGREINTDLPGDWKELIAETVKHGSIKTVDVPCNKVIYSFMIVPVSKAGYVNLYGRDITGRRQAEQALFESEEKYRLIADNSNDWVYWIKPDRSFRYVSPSCERITGFTHLEFMTNPRLFNEIIHPEDGEKVKSHVEVTQDQADEGTLEYRIITKSGKIRWISHSCAKMYSTDGDYVGRRGTNRDITERKQAEESLRKREAEIRSLYESMTELVVLHEVIYDAGGKAIDYRIIECNPVFEKVTGISQSEAVGALASEVYGTGAPPYLEIYAPVAETGVPVNFETEFSPLGKHFHISVFSPEKGHFATLSSDITDRKRAESELHHTLEELKASNAELEQFAYVASHDLQEPLRGIAGLAQLLQNRYQGQLDSQADEFINLIVDGTQRMQTLINDLLAYSRIGRRGEMIQPTDTEEALKVTLKNLDMAIREYGARITHESLPKVKADATQLIQLFQNLIGNAIKFRSERPPEIHIGVADAGDFWQFSVRDNGIGIEPQYFERIFQVFQRLHTRREYKGTGIGLAICKKIIERHGGKIWVESEPGNGSIFYFTLPKGN